MDPSTSSGKALRRETDVDKARRALFSIGAARRIAIVFVHLVKVVFLAMAFVVVADANEPPEDQFWRSALAVSSSKNEFALITLRINAAAAQQECCKVCTTGKACGDTCIAREKTCRVGVGCACDG